MEYLPVAQAADDGTELSTARVEPKPCDRTTDPNGARDTTDSESEHCGTPTRNQPPASAEPDVQSDETVEVDETGKSEHRRTRPNDAIPGESSDRAIVRAISLMVQTRLFFPLDLHPVRTKSWLVDCTSSMELTLWRVPSQRRTTGGFEKSSETARANWKVWTHLQRSTTTILSQPRRSQHMTRGAERNSIQKRFVKDEPRNCTSWTRSS